MNPHILLRVLIIAIGLLVLSGGVTSAFSSAWSLSKSGFLPSETRDYYVSVLIGYGIFPTLVGASLTLFPKRIATKLLGSPVVGDESGPLTPKLLVVCVIRLMGLYLLSTYGSAMAATFFEIIALRAGNTQLDEAKIMADTVANSTGIGVALLLCFRTGFIFQAIFQEGQKGK
jgi:hypothetical protein